MLMAASPHNCKLPYLVTPCACRVWGQPCKVGMPATLRCLSHMVGVTPFFTALALVAALVLHCIITQMSHRQLSHEPSQSCSSALHICSLA
jgi:hypothetical protein